MESSGWRKQLPPELDTRQASSLTLSTGLSCWGTAVIPTPIHQAPLWLWHLLEGPPPHPPPEQVPQLPAQGLPPSLLFSASCINLDGS